VDVEHVSRPALEFLESCDSLVPQGEGVLGDAQLAGAPDLGASAIEGLDDLAQREEETRPLEVGYRCLVCHHDVRADDRMAALTGRARTRGKIADLRS
jgi:hypothetical protein